LLDGGRFNAYSGFLNDVHRYLNINLSLSPGELIILKDMFGVEENARQNSEFFETINHELRTWDIATYTGLEPMLAGSSEVLRGEHNLPFNTWITPANSLFDYNLKPNFGYWMPQDGYRTQLIKEFFKDENARLSLEISI